MKEYRHKESAGCFPTSGNKLRGAGQRGRNAYKEWIDLTFRYRVLHVTPLRVEERGETNKKMQEFRNYMKPEEEILHCTRRKRMNRRTRRRIRKKEKEIRHSFQKQQNDRISMLSQSVVMCHRKRQLLFSYINTRQNDALVSC